MSKNQKKRYKPKGPENLYAYFIGANPKTSNLPKSMYPTIDKTTFIGPFSSVIGDVRIGKNVFVACNVTLRADEGSPFFIGDNCNLQDGAVLHGLTDKFISIHDEKYSIYIGNNVSITHGALVHGPCIVGDNVFIGFNATVFNAIIGDGCYIDTAAIVIEGVTIPPNRYVPIAAFIDTQEKANALGPVPQSQEEFAQKVIRTNVELAGAYSMKFGDTRCSCGICCNSTNIIRN